MKKFYVINVENLNKYVATSKHVLALRILSFLIRKHYNLPTSETVGRRLEGLLSTRKYSIIRRTVIYSLFNLGFSKSEIARLGFNRSTIYRSLKAAESSREIRSYFLTIKDGISEVWI